MNNINLQNDDTVITAFASRSGKIVKTAVILLFVATFYSLATSGYSEMFPIAEEKIELSTISNESHSIQQQPESVIVSGTVIDERGEPLPGVSIRVGGTSQGTSTDIEGKFELNTRQGATLIISFVGYKTQELPVGNVPILNRTITLQEDIGELSEVVVVGYTTQSRRDISSSVAKVNMDIFESNPTSSLLNLLSGQIPGMQSIRRGGTPGASGGGLVIRGNTSLSADDGLAGISNPLFIMDGVPMSLQDIAGFDVSQNDFLASLNPDDIESISILKDAAATAIYGSRGANGVVIITSKRGTSGRARLTGSISTGITATPQKMGVYIGEAERQAKLDLYQKSLTALFGEQAWVDIRNGLEVMGYMLPSVLTDKYNPAFNNAYNYQEMFYQPGFSQNYNLSFEGGKEGSSYRVGLDHYDEKGVLVGYGFSRSTLSASLVNDINKYFRNDFIVRYSFLNRKGGLNSYMRALPTSPTELPSSLFYRTPDELDQLSGQLGNAYNKNVTHSLSFSDALRINFTENLSLNNQASVALMFGSNNYFIPSTARADGKTYGQSQSSINSIINANSVLNYTKDFGNHSVVGLLGAEVNTDQQQQSWISAEDGTSDYLKVIQGYQKENINGYSDIVTTNMLSYFASAAYGFKRNRYKVEGVLRRDASSRFGANNKWATFPSIKVHWIFSDEPWMENTSDWIDFGKIRISYGTSGSIASDPLLQYNSLISLSNIGAGMNDIYSNKMDVKTYGGLSLLISDFNKVANKNLSWSKSNEINYGLDLELFNRRLFITGDIYSRYISGLIYRSFLPPYVGFNSLESNLVDMMSNGFELGITAHLFPHSGDFQWTWTANFANNKTIVAKLGNGGRDYISGDYAFVVGRPAFQYYTYEYIGALDSFDDLPVNPMNGEALRYYAADAGLALGLQGRIFPGMPLYTDVNGDYLIDGGDYGNDKKIIENKSPEPKIQGGLNTTIRYKNFSLRAHSSFAFGHYIFNTTLQQQLTNFDSPERFFQLALYKFDETKFWQKPGDGSYYPMMYIGYSDGGSARSFRRSSMFIEQGDYWSIDNVTLSYNLPDKLISQLKLNRVNVYMTVNNPYMWKKSQVFDPRMVSKTGYYNGSGYPLSRNYLFGLQFQF
ncbi:SusC/RagA family [Proteiniphilum saccharofermentans]|uniref:SusC/RagA family n=1 Tax=Proteiniphilum saccharofermentans TaxID=1642647 RepID=A0A1R3TD64_9BACT|nr:SusC/RagA family TonB-linked outer membrane protein [Proteiniphilum saccharofermentans]SCD21945.1 SusC/RagA family [Proteiniphilum saccharofermentans]